MPREIAIAPLEKTDRFAIVVAQWNRSVTERLLQGAVETLAAAGAEDDAVDVARVPGAWEIPLAAQRFAARGEYRAVIALGAVIKGETSHDEHINRSVSAALAELALRYDVPVLLGLLTCHTMQQAVDRAGGPVGNKGAECAAAAIHMAGLLKRLPRAD
jgi:6,7-dimethyl-8-ribityllumazine synthase